jgi:hypothetical protein
MVSGTPNASFLPTVLLMAGMSQNLREANIGDQLT